MEIHHELIIFCYPLQKINCGKIEASIIHYQSEYAINTPLTQRHLNLSTYSLPLMIFNLTKICLDPFSNIWYQLGFHLKNPSTDSRAKQD